MFELKNVSKQFQTKEQTIKAVKNVSLKIKPKEIFGIIGASGAGKSTLIRTLNLLEKPDSGEILFKNENLLELSKNEVRARRKKIGMVFQNFNLFNSRSVFDNVAFPIDNLSKAETEIKVKKLLEIVDLSDKIYAYPSQLSGGQKQRVAIARALANDPDVLLCDEATSALDPQTTSSILNLLKNLNETLNLTIVLITHEMSVIKSICDRVAIMDQGEVVEVNDVINVFTNPRKQITKNLVIESFNFDNVKSLITTSKHLLDKNSQVYEFIYGKESSIQALISKLIKKFHLEINIISGTIEIVKNQSIGRLIVIVNGEINNINSGLNYLNKAGVIINELKY